MIRKVTNENVNDVMEMCFRKFKKMEYCKVPSDPDKGKYTLTPHMFSINGMPQIYDPTLDDSYYLWDCNVQRMRGVPFQIQPVLDMIQIFTYPNDIRRFKKGAFAWFRYKYVNLTQECKKKEIENEI